MYRLEVAPNRSGGFTYTVYCREFAIVMGSRGSEGEANKDGASDMGLCRMFSIGFNTNDQR